MSDAHMQIVVDEIGCLSLIRSRAPTDCGKSLHKQGRRSSGLAGYVQTCRLRNVRCA